MPLFYHKYVNYVLAHSVNYVITLYSLLLPLHQSLLFPLIFAKEHLSLALLAPPVAPNTAIPTNLAKAVEPLAYYYRPRKTRTVYF